MATRWQRRRRRAGVDDLARDLLRTGEVVLDPLTSLPWLPRTLRPVDQLEEYRGPLRDAPRASGAVYLAGGHLVVRRGRPVAAQLAFRRYAERRNRELLSLWMRSPGRVDFCVRRKVRKEVLFARGVAGRSGGSPKRNYERTQNSQYSCV